MISSLKSIANQNESDESRKHKQTNFSIEHILKHAGTSDKTFNNAQTIYSPHLNILTYVEKCVFSTPLFFEQPHLSAFRLIHGQQQQTEKNKQQLQHTWITQTPDLNNRINESRENLSSEEDSGDYQIENNSDQNNIVQRKVSSSQSSREESLSWLHCTRYCPPKLIRNKRNGPPRPRQLGRHPRIPFSSQQVAILEAQFRKTPYLSSTDVTTLSRALNLADVRVKIWFQNRRARERREKNEPLNNHDSNKDQHLMRPSILFTEDTILNENTSSISSNNANINEYNLISDISRENNRFEINTSYRGLLLK